MRSRRCERGCAVRLHDAAVRLKWSGVKNKEDDATVCVRCDDDMVLSVSSFQFNGLPCMFGPLGTKRKTFVYFRRGSGEVRSLRRSVEQGSMPCNCSEGLFLATFPVN